MAKKKVPIIPECPAFARCKECKATCDICLALPVAAWREHVRAVLSPANSQACAD